MIRTNSTANVIASITAASNVIHRLQPREEKWTPVVSLVIIVTSELGRTGLNPRTEQSFDGRSD